MVSRLAQPWGSLRRSRDHRHAYFELALVIAGRCDWRLGGRRRLTLATGDLLLLPPWRLHREEVPAGTDAMLQWIGFTASGEVLDVLSPLLERPWPAGVWARDLDELGGLLYRDHQRPDLPGRAEREEALLRALLVTLRRVVVGAELATSPGRHGAALQAAAHTLQRNLDQAPRVAELARGNGLTPGHFSALFAATHGESPRAFLQRSRLAEARRRLAAGRETVKEIAAACGYSGAPHFCRAFKAATGLSPRAWRLREKPAATRDLPT